MVRQSVLAAMTTRAKTKAPSLPTIVEELPQTKRKDKTVSNKPNKQKQVEKSVPKTSKTASDFRHDATDKRLDMLGGDMVELKAMMASMEDYIKPGHSTPVGTAGAGQDLGAEGSSDEEETPVSDPPTKRRKKATARPAHEAEATGAALLDRVHDLLLFAGDYPTDMGMDHDGYHFNEHDRNLANNGKPRLVSGSLRTADLRVPKKHVLWLHKEGVYLDGPHVNEVKAKSDFLVKSHYSAHHLKKMTKMHLA